MKKIPKSWLSDEFKDKHKKLLENVDKIGPLNEITGKNLKEVLETALYFEEKRELLEKLN